MAEPRADEPRRVTTEAELHQAVRDKTVTTIRVEGEIELTRPVKVGTSRVVAIEGAGVGTLRIHSHGGPYAVKVYRSGSHLTLSGIRLTGTGVRVSDRGRLTATDTTIDGPLGCGVLVEGSGSRALISAGQVRQSTEYGISCKAGGHVTVKGVEVSDNKRAGVWCEGQESRVDVERGKVQGSEEYGIVCEAGGHVTVKGVEVSDNKQGGVLCGGQESRVDVEGGKVQDPWVERSSWRIVFKDA